MLRELLIRNIVLIDRLDLTFDQGLTVLTGETGAGKSILLDSLSLVLGVRGRADLVRTGTNEGHVTALFDIKDCASIITVLEEHNIPIVNDDLLIRRVQNSDGRSKAYINDTPVSLPLLRQVGNTLVEIHGQHDARALIDPSSHLDLLDNFGKLGKQKNKVQKCWDKWRDLEQKIQTTLESMAALERDRNYFQHSLEELADLAPEVGEEITLADNRQRMMKSEGLAAELDQVLSFLGGAHSPAAELGSLMRSLARHTADLPDLLDEGLDTLGKAIDQFHEAEQAFSIAREKAHFDPYELERIEERLFALRALARKHRISVDELPDLQNEFAQKLEGLHSSDERLKNLEIEQKQAKETYFIEAKALSKARMDTIARLASGVAHELPALKLGNARFYVDIASDPEHPQRKGFDSVAFHVQTNPGSVGGLIGKVASGGELSRFTLALKVVLASETGAATLIFDEVDTGVGGAVADAIGERLARLSRHSQLLTVTHAPQVAVKANRHLLIKKDTPNQETLPITSVAELNDTARQEEVARMLAGATITDEARAAAARLMTGEPSAS